MNDILEVQSLKKTFRNQWTFSTKEVLKDVNFCIKSGEIVGYLGQNGAGKTTTFKIICGLDKPSKGKIRIEGKNPLHPPTRMKLGFVPESPYFYDHLSVKETLSFHASLVGVTNKLEKLEFLEPFLFIREIKEKPIRNLSKGQKQRIALAQALLHSPSLLILDEPFSGLDPESRYRLKQLIINLSKDKVAILFSSHIISEVEQISNRVLLLKNGSIVDEDSITHYTKKEANWELCVERSEKAEKLSDELFKSRGIEIINQATESNKHIVLRGKDERLGDLVLAESITAGVSIISFVRRRTSLEELITKK